MITVVMNNDRADDDRIEITCVDCVDAEVEKLRHKVNDMNKVIELLEIQVKILSDDLLNEKTRMDRLLAKLNLDIKLLQNRQRDSEITLQKEMRRIETETGANGSKITDLQTFVFANL